MAIETTSAVLFDSPHLASMQFTGHSADGAGETDAVKVDVSELTPPCSRVHPTRIIYDVQGGAIKLLWGGDPASEAFLILSGRDERDYSWIGGLPNKTEDATGDILLSTVDWGVNASYSLTIEMKKK